ncbi:hypothetical protein K1719_032197 [Acacia pycnantha]|nr:hypothetical protein K1719_032197 [Acacia pycnantha]
MSVNGDDEELQELTQRLLVGKKIHKDGVTGEENGLYDKNELQVNRMVEEFKVGQEETVKGELQVNGIVEEFKVLLVENARHVVTALLRNCCYEVIEAANGLQAWKTLEDLTNHIDLILTEMAMPCLSGIGLLCKIMGHQTRKNIPVIMMSSHDSMGLVFKCFSKGAVDLLVKPIRKNELKNLWQHIWRRCHSSSGSRSESDSQTQKSVKSKSLEKSGNNTYSNDEDNNKSEDLNNRNGSDNGSETQTSWTKQAVEVDSFKQVPQWDQICCPNNKKQLGSSKVNGKNSRGQLDLICRNPSGKLRPNGPSVFEAVTGEEFGAQNRRHKLSDIENKATNDDELPSPGLSLKRLGGVEEAGILIQDKQNAARSSYLSAFSGNASSNAEKSPTGCIGTGSNSPHNNSLEVTKKDFSCEIQSHSNVNPPHRSSNGASNNIDIGSTASNAFTKIEFSREPEVASTAKCLYHVSAVQPISNDLCTCHQVVLHKNRDMTTVTMLAPKGGIRKDYPTVDFHCQFENHDSNADKQYQHNHVDSTLKEMAAAAPHYGSPNVVEVLVECNTEDNSVNRSASGSNNRSNGLNGSSTAVDDRRTNIEGDNGFAGNNESGDPSGSKSGSGNKSANKSCIHKQVQHLSRKKLAEQRPHFCGQFVHKSTNENAPEAEDN